MKSKPPSSSNGSAPQGRKAPVGPGILPGQTAHASEPSSSQSAGPRSAASVALERYDVQAATPRRKGTRAEVAWLRAQLQAASDSGDSGGEGVTAAALARALAKRGIELDVATKLARRALVLVEDAAFREDLAQWFAALGEPALAAATLRPALAEQSGKQACTILTRMGILLGRAGDAAGAADALSEAARQVTADPVAPELFGTLGAWAPQAVGAERAAEGYVEAARRREARGEKAAAFEDLLRAFEIAPASPVVVERLCATLASRGRTGAADEIRRQQARARGARGREVHLRRMRDLAAEGDLPRALGAALDARLELQLEPEGALRAVGLLPAASSSEVTFDELLHQAGLHELLAARLELHCEAQDNPQRVRSLLALGRVCSGPLASPERAVDAWVEALSLDPGCEEARSGLRAYAASTHDFSPLVEALIREALSGAHHPAAAHAASVRELILLAEQRLNDPGLALWALRLLQQHGVEDSELGPKRARLEPLVAQQEEQLTALRRALGQAQGSERERLLRRLAAVLSGRPDQAAAYVDVLAELVRLLPEEPVWRVRFERLCWRTARSDRLAAALREVVFSADRDGDSIRAALALAAIHRRDGDLRAALDVLEPSLSAASASAALWSMALVLASMLGDEVVRGKALGKLSASLQPSLRAVLGSVVADAFLMAGDVHAARAAAEQASHADPTMARPLAALAAVSLSSGEPPDVETIERAMGVVVPRAAMCAALAQAYEAVEEYALAVAWTGRWLALRPGDPMAAEAMLRRVTLAGEPARLADALAGLLSQPQPMTQLAPTLAEALTRLVRLDPKRGVVLARRTLDVVGPRIAEVRRAVLEVASAAGEVGIAIAAQERWLAAGAGGSDRLAVLLELARLRTQVQDADGAARTLVRAMAEGCDPKAVYQQLEVALPAQTSDGELSLLEARAEALSALPDVNLAGAAAAWRDFGAACWDLAEDTDRAAQAWERAAALDPERGIERLARDLVAFAGAEQAVLRLAQLSRRRREPAEQVRILAAAANVALQAGQQSQAFELAIEALRTDPAQSEPLAIAERAATETKLAELVAVYDLVADCALGCYGVRAARYRAARQLDRRGMHADAFRNALAAFEAVPAAGVTFVLAAHLAEQTDNTLELVRGIERVAARATDERARAFWLERAAKFAGSDEEGKRERVEVLLRALMVRPDGEALRSLGEAVTDLVRHHPEDSEIIELRFERAVAEVLARLDGPDGARAAIEAACVALSTLDSAPLATTALEQAVRSCAEVEEYRRLWELAPRLANAPEQARAVLALMQDRSSAKFAAVSREMVELGVLLAHEFDDVRSAASLLVHAALRDRDDAALARRAAEATEQSGDADLLALMVEVVPSDQRRASLLAVVAAAEQAEDPQAALEALASVLESRDLDDSTRRDVLDRLRELHIQQGTGEALESLLAAELQRREVGDPACVQLAAELIKLAQSEVQAVRVLPLVTAVVREHADDLALLGEWVQLARRGGDRQTLIEALGSLLQSESDPAARLGLWRQLAQLHAELGQETETARCWSEVLQLDPQALDALEALARDAQRRGDLEEMAALLGSQAEAVSEPATLRRLRLQRAQLLEQQLGRRDEARAELEVLLAQAGDELESLRMLADLYQRSGDELRAAPLWLRAARLVGDAEQAGELRTSACQAYLRGGDVVSARRVLDELSDVADREGSLKLRVEIERASEDPLALADALERLAQRSTAGAEPRAQLLLEAMRAAQAGGDSERALAFAKQAAGLAPHAPEPQLAARLLEYRARGAGGAADARVTVAELRGISRILTPEQAELRAFLVAEALEVAVNVDVALGELERAEAELGLRPLLALAVAVRLARGEQAARSLDFFDAALAGDLRELADRGSVAMQAAEVAYAADQHRRALRYLEVAGKETATRADALALAAMIRDDLRSKQAPKVKAPSDAARAAVDPAARLPAAAEQPGEAPEQLPGTQRSAAAEVSAAGRGSERPPGTLRYPGLVEAIDAGAAIEELDADDLEMISPGRTAEPAKVSPHHAEVVSPDRLAEPEELDADEVEMISPGRPPGGPRHPESMAEALAAAAEAMHASRPELEQPAQAGEAQEPAAPERPAATDATPTADDEDEPPLSDPAHPAFPPSSRDEASLLDALARGSIQAGNELLTQLDSEAGRTHDRVAVCRRLAVLMPGDRTVLQRLQAAAAGDQDPVYAQAVDHVRTAFISDGSAVPPLAEQPEQPDQVQAVLFRGVLGPAARALALVWDSASHVFQRDPASYQITGLERVPQGAPTAVGRAYSQAARVLGMTRTPLFHQRRSAHVMVNVALLSPPAVIIAGDLERETPELYYHFGAMLAATLSENILLFGVPPDQMRRVLDALIFAFGPPSRRTSKLTAVANLAEVLWESLPASAQRELREICDDPSRLRYGPARAAARRAVRRAGLFVAGDLEVAVRAVCDELQIAPEVLDGPDGLAVACSSSPDISDLVRLATSPQYAQARWQLPHQTRQAPNSDPRSR